MLRFDTKPLLGAVKMLAVLREDARHRKPTDHRPAEMKDQDVQLFKSYAETFSELGMTYSKIQANRVAAIMEASATVSQGDISSMCADLASRMEDEISQRHFLSFSDREMTFYEPSRPLFGEEVDDKLPQAIEDVSEAAKCFALGRYTASVFHLMRVMETGVQKFGEKLGVQLTDQKVWQVILDGTNAEIKKLGKAAHAKKYASISAHLYNVKLAWRNEAMHPKATYTAEEAEVIFAAVRGFMIDLVGVL
jgi:hypothetical protein